MTPGLENGAIDALFERLFDEYRQPLLNYLYRLLGEAERAEEVCQDVFVRAYRALPRLPQGANHRAWLYRIATNAATDCYRRRRLLQWLPLRDEEADGMTSQAQQGPEAEVSERSAVGRALVRLPLAYRQVLLLFVLQGFSVREIAEMLGISDGAVKTRLFRARERFRTEYGKESGDAL